MCCLVLITLCAACEKHAERGERAEAVPRETTGSSVHPPVMQTMPDNSVKDSHPACEEPDVGQVQRLVGSFTERVLLDTTAVQVAAAPAARPSIEELRERVQGMGNNRAVATVCTYAFSEPYSNTNRLAIIAVLEDLLSRGLDTRQSNAVHSTIAFQFVAMHEFDHAVRYVDALLGSEPSRSMPLLRNFCMARRHAYRGLLHNMIRNRHAYTLDEYHRKGAALREKMEANAALLFSIDDPHREREIARYRDLDRRDWDRFHGVKQD